MSNKGDLLKGTIFDPELKPYLLESEKNLSQELESDFKSKIEHLKENWVVFCSLAPLSILYFHVRLALLLRHIQNLKGRIFLLNLDQVILAHTTCKYYRYYPIGGKEHFISLLKAVGVNTDSERKFQHADWRLLNSRIADRDEYFRYIHAIDMVELVETIKSIKETSHFRQFIDLKAYVDDVFLASTIVREEFGGCDFISGSIDRIPVYNYCAKVLKSELNVLPPSIMPFASMPLIEAKGPEPYPAIEDSRKGGTIKSKLEDSRLSKCELILLMKTLLEFYEEVTQDKLDALNRIRGQRLNNISYTRILDITAKGMEELFLLLHEKMEPGLPPEVKEFTSREDLKKILLNMGIPSHMFIVLEKILDAPKGITASEIHRSLPQLDKTTIYRDLERWKRAGIVIGTLRQPRKYRATAKKIIVKMESG